MGDSNRPYIALSAALATLLTGLILRDVYADWILEGKAFWTTIAENILPLVLGVALFLTGYWVYRTRGGRYTEAVARWQLFAAAGTLLLVGSVVGFQLVQGEIKPFVIVSQTTIGGATAGSLIGYANARQADALATTRRERDRSEALFENIPAEAAEVRMTDDGIVIERVNDAFENVFHTPDGDGLLSSAVPHDESVHEQIRNHIVDGEPLEREVTVDTPAETQYYQLRVVPFEADSAYVMYTDVTELRETQTELEATVSDLEASNDRLEQYETIIDTAPVGIVATDPTDHSQFNIVNDAFLDLFDADSAEAFQQIALEEIYADPDRREEILTQIDAAGSVVDEEVQFKTLGGREFHGSLTAQIIGEGEDQSLVAIIFDITERIEYQQDLEASNERLEDFAYIASHDLQEPLRTVSRYAALVLEDYGDELDEAGRDSLETVITGAERMSSMVNGLLDYSRVTTRGGEFEQVDTEAVVEEVRQDLQVLTEEYDGTITVDSLPAVEADRDQLWQVFQNLVKNALEHSDDEQVTVTVSGTETPEGVQLTVADDGPGIDPYIEDEIFTIFKSGQNYQTESEARGIGLAVVERIIDRHGGDIRVESEPGKGSTFVFTIPQ